MPTISDVPDRTFEKLGALRKKWMSWFDIEKKNSIALQLTNITWDITCFKILDEAARLAPQAADGGKELNGAVFNLLSRCFAKSLMSDIRKLVDIRKGNISLRRLLEDIQRERGLFTRQAVFAAEGIDYDPSDAIRRENALVEEQIRQGKTFFHGPNYEDSSERINSRHEQIDFLCQTSSDRRKPTDNLGPRFIPALIAEMDAACGSIKQYVDENIAHAGEVAHPSQATAHAPTWESVYLAHKQLCRVAGFVHLFILGSSQLPFSPMPGHDTLAYISRSLVAEAEVGAVYLKLQEFWNECVELSAWKPTLQTIMTI